MKHLYKFSLFLLALLLPAIAAAHDIEVDGIYYNINGDEATVTYKGTSYSSGAYSGSVTIPATVTYGGTTYSVTSIGDNAFNRCGGLTSVNIPNSVTTIGESAFNRCSSLTSIIVAGDNSNYDSRGNCNAIIETASNTLILGCKNTVIPNSVTSIGSYAFYGCTGLTSIDIPNSVTTIGHYAFYGCSSLTSIDIPNSVTSIGGYAFSYCEGLHSIAIGKSVTEIGIYAFDGCSGLTSVYITDLAAWCSIDFSISPWDLPYNWLYDEYFFTSNPLHFANHLFLNRVEVTDLTIPNSVTNIKAGTFWGCGGLTSITIPNSVSNIGEYAFMGCSNLTSIKVANDNPKYDSRNNCNAIIETATNTLVIGCKNSTIPNSVTSIGNEAFWGCDFMTNIAIPNSITNIGDYAFAGCSGLTSIDIPNSVTTIGDEAFFCCHSLSSVTIPNSVTTIGDYAFAWCDYLFEVYCLHLTPPTIKEDSFMGFCGTTYVPDIALDNYTAADYWKEFNIVGMPYTFEVDGTRYHATTLNTASVMANNDEAALYSGEMVIPDSVTYEGMSFAVTGIESNAFDGCFDLTSITIPNSVETIGEQTFQGCTGLTSVTIGSGVTSIGAKAFNYCNALETVKCLGTVPPVMASTDCFTNTAYNRATLLVPRQFVEAYQAADYWYKFAYIDGWGSAGRGDIDGDGEVSIRDVTTMIDAILTGDNEGVYFESADLNNNGRLDIGDVTTIIDMLLNGN